jgi:hypothetical protein
MPQLILRWLAGSLHLFRNLVHLGELEHPDARERVRAAVLRQARRAVPGEVVGQGLPGTGPVEKRASVCGQGHSIAAAAVSRPSHMVWLTSLLRLAPPRTTSSKPSSCCAA